MRHSSPLGKELAYYTDHRRAVKRVMVAGPTFFILAIALTMRDVSTTPILLGVLGLALGAMLYLYYRKHPVIQFNREGVRASGYDLIPWDQITGLHRSDLMDEPQGLFATYFNGPLPAAFNHASAGRVLELRLRDRDAFLSGLSPWRRLMFNVMTSRSSGEVRIDLSSLSDEDFASVENKLNAIVFECGYK